MTDDAAAKALRLAAERDQVVRAMRWNMKVGAQLANRAADFAQKRYDRALAALGVHSGTNQKQ